MPRGNPNLHLVDKRPWPQERADQLKRLFVAGCSDEEIALALAITKRAVIGKRLRLGLRRWIKHDDDPLTMALRRWVREPKQE